MVMEMAQFWEMNWRRTRRIPLAGFGVRFFFGVWALTQSRSHSPLLTPPVKMAFRRCSCVALLVFYMIIALTWSNSLVGADTITTELPLQACPNIMRQVQGDNILMYLNGSRGSFHAPPSPGKPFDMESSLYFQWTDVREVGRTGVRCSNSLDVPINILPLYECDCAITVVSTVANGVKKTGWEMTISGCPAPQQNLVAKAQVTTTNVTTVEIFNKTMPHSTADAFNYTSTYVQALTSSFLRHSGIRFAPRRRHQFWSLQDHSHIVNLVKYCLSLL